MYKYYRRQFSTRKHLGIQSYSRHMVLSEPLTYNIGEPNGHKRSTSTNSYVT
jgi:hypothetical protein